MLSNGQMWKNGNRVAQINIEEKIFKAVIFKMEKEKLSFSKTIKVRNEHDLFDRGFKPTEQVLVARAR